MTCESWNAVMTINKDMIQAAVNAGGILGESSPLVADFLRTQINTDGGFTDRFGRSDIYYSVFGLSGLSALRDDGDLCNCYEFVHRLHPEELSDLVHLSAYIRCCTILEINRDETSSPYAELINNFRAEDGGFSDRPRLARGNIYSCFLALGAYQDLAISMPGEQGMLNCLRSLQLANGGFKNQGNASTATVPATAAALSIFHYLKRSADNRHLHWLRQQYRAGGFPAAEGVPLPDLLSTATAIHALALHSIDLADIKESTLDYVDTLWSSQGGFYAGRFDETLDCEYTFYGLLTIGNLA